MAKVPRRFQIDDSDVAAENQDVLMKIATLMNPFVEDTVSAFDGRLDIYNLNMQMSTVSVRVDSNGVPIQGETIRSQLIDGKRVNGIICVRAVNDNNPSRFASGTPFVSFIQSGDIITLQNVTNLPPNETFLLTLLII